MKNFTLNFYYIAVIAVLLTQTVYAVYNQGIFINQTDTAHALTLQKQELHKEQLILRNALAKSSALTTVADQSLLAEFQPMSKPLVLHTSTNVALSSF